LNYAIFGVTGFDQYYCQFEDDFALLGIRFVFKDRITTTYEN